MPCLRPNVNKQKMKPCYETRSGYQYLKGENCISSPPAGKEEHPIVFGSCTNALMPPPGAQHVETRTLLKTRQNCLQTAGNEQEDFIQTEENNARQRMPRTASPVEPYDMTE